MGWSFRKSVTLAARRFGSACRKAAPRLSVGIPGARASINMQGKARIYAGKGPLRYQSAVSIRPTDAPTREGGGLLARIKRAFGGP